MSPEQITAMVCQGAGVIIAITASVNASNRLIIARLDSLQEKIGELRGGQSELTGRVGRLESGSQTIMRREEGGA